MARASKTLGWLLAGAGLWLVTRLSAGARRDGGVLPQPSSPSAGGPFAPFDPFSPSGASSVLDVSTLTAHNSTLAARRALFEPYFSAAEARHSLPPGLLLQQGIAESELVPSARSSAGAVGLMQMLPQYFPGAGVDPLADIERAATEMARLFAVFGSWTLALAAYNAGQGTVERYGNRVPPFLETRAYVVKILGPLGLSEPGLFA
jgi:hypothetical protein